MDKQQWLVIKQIFDSASELPSEQQQAYVNEHADGNNAIASKVMAMLAQSTDSLTRNVHQMIDHSLQQMVEAQNVLQIGDTVEQFRVISALGEGGMGSIFLAQRESDDFEQLVAIKVIHRKQVSQENEARFKRERQILAKLNHKHIASLIGGGQTSQGFPYIILEFIDGIPIDEYCEQHKLNVRQVLSLFKQVLNALSYAHQNLVVHRDIKPSNVLVTAQGDVKLLDFGIAELLENNHKDTHASGQNTDNLDDLEGAEIQAQGERLLSYVSASPEQVLGEAITTVTDIYGLGALLYSMLTKHNVFDTATHSKAELLELIVSKTPIRASEKCKQSSSDVAKSRASDITQDLDGIIEMALKKLPSERYNSTEHFKQDIDNFLDNYPVDARPSSNWYAFVKFVQRNRLSTALSTVIILGVVTSMLVIKQQSMRIEQERNTAIEQAVIAKQTLNYLTDIFIASDPNINSGETLSAKMLLDQAKDNINDIDASDSIKAELLITLTRVYSQIGEYETAVAMQPELESLVLSGNIGSARQVELELMYLEASMQLNLFLGEFEKSVMIAETLLEKLSQADEFAGQFDISIDEYQIKAVFGLATALTNLNQSQRSADYYQQVISMALNTELESEYLAPGYFGLGHSLREAGDLQASILALTAGIAAERKYNSQETLELAHGLNQLASTLLKLGQLDKAMPHAQEGLRIRQAIHQPGNVEILASMGIVANIYAARSEYEKALDIRSQGLILLGEAVGKEHIYYVIWSGSMAQLNELVGNYSEAIAMADSALESFDKLDPNGHRYSIIPHIVKAEALMGMDNLIAAAAQIEKAQSVNAKFNDASHHYSARLEALSSILNILSDKQANKQGAPEDTERLEAALLVYSNTYPVSSHQYKTLLRRADKLLSLIH